MIHEAYMPVYMGSRFLARDGTGPIGGSTRGPRGPKNCSGRGICLRDRPEKMSKFSKGRGGGLG